MRDVQTQGNRPMRRKQFLLAAASAALGLLAAGPAARAATETPFTAAAFAAAQAADKPILVHIWASWCPTCAKQTPILKSLAADPSYADLMIFRVDFDAQKDVVRAMGADHQSTLVVFHGKDEKGRSVGDTEAASITALVAKSKG